MSESTVGRFDLAIHNKKEVTLLFTTTRAIVLARSLGDKTSTAFSAGIIANNLASYVLPVFPALASYGLKATRWGLRHNKQRKTKEPLTPSQLLALDQRNYQLRYSEVEQLLVATPPRRDLLSDTRHVDLVAVTSKGRHTFDVRLKPESVEVADHILKRLQQPDLLGDKLQVVSHGK